MHNFKLRIILVSFSILLIVFALIVFALPFFAIGCERLLIKWEAQNPHIDSDYLGWKTIYISGYSSMMIPESWAFKESDGLYYIYDDNRELWAVGASFGNNDAKFESYKELAETVYQESLFETTIEPFTPFLMMDGSNVARMIAKGSSKEKTYYCIQLFKSTEQEFVWLLEKDLSENTKNYDIVEALIYSYAFAKE